MIRTARLGAGQFLGARVQLNKVDMFGLRRCYGIVGLCELIGRVALEFGCGADGWWDVAQDKIHGYCEVSCGAD